MASVGRPPKGDRAKPIDNVNSGTPKDIEETIHGTVSQSHPVEDTQIPNTVSGPKKT